MFECTQCSRKFDDWRAAEAHAEEHLVVTTIPLDDTERHRIINALLVLATQQENAARGHALVGPAWKDTRAILRKDARDCRALAKKVREAS
jgi:hypothetical protein